jgi:hypothetical protein
MFLDNLTIPAKVEMHKNNLHSMESCKTIKARFSDFVNKLERKSCKNLEIVFA